MNINEEIKFRAWDKKGNRMLYVVQIHFNDDKVLLTDGFLDGWFTFEEIELMRYTSFRDCYGKRIFEGDIIEYGNSRHDRGAVVMEGGMWYIQDFDRLVSLGYPKICAYINSNVYENPELLTQ